ncbi:hypothetical protein Lalb_Chr02g0153791 [Lupinus albus]|uniref:Uncharacterized protein n=1 Tax=Lupinus albus TaxID=3870 RepID=A0A6A4QYM0_LUPAL|nr:hypothetical protein Lalb_Chr02g0153791 [Lupinus albus]
MIILWCITRRSNRQRNNMNPISYSLIHSSKNIRIKTTLTPTDLIGSNSSLCSHSSCFTLSIVEQASICNNRTCKAVEAVCVPWPSVSLGDLDSTDSSMGLSKYDSYPL